MHSHPWQKWGWEHSIKWRWYIVLILGNFFLTVNFDNTVGAIGFVSRIIPTFYPIAIIRVDPHNGEPIRDAKGLCIRCNPGKYDFKCYLLQVRIEPKAESNVTFSMFVRGNL
jgi:hypothetical protein